MSEKNPTNRTPSKPYREGDEEETKQAAQPQPEQESSPFVGADGQLVDARVVTAVLLVELEDGRVLPITKIANLEMQREATPHHILRMCADAQDQVSAVRSLSEGLQATRKMIDHASIKLFEALTGKPAPRQWYSFLSGEGTQETK